MTSHKDIRYQPLYRISEAAHYIHAHPQTLRAWLLGSEAGQNPSILEPATYEEADKLSFVNLIEAHMLVALRTTHKVSMRKIREAVQWLKKETGYAHPLAECIIQTDGKCLFVEHFGALISANEQGQIFFRKIMESFLHRVERDKEGIPVLFYPFTRGVAAECPKDIVMTPDISFGRPIIKGTRISTQILVERFLAGDSVGALADDYELNPKSVEEAVRCELDYLKAA